MEEIFKNKYVNFLYGTNSFLLTFDINCFQGYFPHFQFKLEFKNHSLKQFISKVSENELQYKKTTINYTRIRNLYHCMTP